MRTTAAVLILATITTSSLKADNPAVERYLHSGKHAQGERELMIALSLDPEDDQTRFGLGVIQFLRGIERLGQSLHRYGVKSRHTDIPFLRLPVPENPDAERVTYGALRKVLNQFLRDMARAEVTLAAIRDDQVKLPLRLAEIKLDLDNDGRATETLVKILNTVMRQEPEFLEQNPEFRVTFDRGDVAWLRAYCHILMAMLDAYLAFDFEALFEQSADDLFANPAPAADATTPDFIKVTEPFRLSRFRRHLIQVAVLNHETWRLIRSEQDDDFEWLPNPRQTGVFGMPIRDNMIDGWLAMMDELKALLEGDRTIPALVSGRRNGLSLKILLEDPPRKIKQRLFEELPDKYYRDIRPVNVGVLSSTITLFRGPDALFYAAWFN